VFRDIKSVIEKVEDKIRGRWEVVDSISEDCF